MHKIIVMKEGKIIEFDYDPSVGIVPLIQRLDFYAAYGRITESEAYEVMRKAGELLFDYKLGLS